MRLYHQVGSRSTRVLWTLEEIGAPYDLEVISREIKRTPEHLARHPLGRVPVLDLDDGSSVFESGAICLYLADLHSSSGLLPRAGTGARARTYQWSFFAQTEIEAAVVHWLRGKRAGRADMDRLARAFSPVVDALEATVSAGPWLLGEVFTVADILCSASLETAYQAGLTDRGGALRDYLDRADSRPAKNRAETVR